MHGYAVTTDSLHSNIFISRRTNIEQFRHGYANAFYSLPHGYIVQHHRQFKGCLQLAMRIASRPYRAIACNVDLARPSLASVKIPPTSMLVGIPGETENKIWVVTISEAGYHLDGMLINANSNYVGSFHRLGPTFESFRCCLHTIFGFYKFIGAYIVQRASTTGCLHSQWVWASALHQTMANCF